MSLRLRVYVFVSLRPCECLRGVSKYVLKIERLVQTQHRDSGRDLSNLEQFLVGRTFRRSCFLGSVHESRVSVEITAQTTEQHAGLGLKSVLKHGQLLRILLRKALRRRNHLSVLGQGSVLSR